MFPSIIQMLVMLSQMLVSYVMLFMLFMCYIYIYIYISTQRTLVHARSPGGVGGDMYVGPHWSVHCSHARHRCILRFQA